MSNNLIQPALSSGELSPNLHARVDLERYQTGLALCRNFFVDYRGGATFRAGTRLVGVQVNHNRLGRLIRFAFNTDQNYVLEFSHGTVRFIKNGEYILNPTSKSITNITQAVEAVVSSASHGFSDGDQVFINGTSGSMSEVNAQTFIVSDSVAGAFKIKWLNGAYVNSTAFTPFVAGSAQATKLYEVASPYQETHLFDLKFAQSGDILTITHPSFGQRELKRLGEDNWTMTTITFAATIAKPATPTITKSADGKTKYSYKVTAMKADGEESVGSNEGHITHAVNIGATAGSIQITWTAVTDAQSYKVYKANPITGLGLTFPPGGSYGFIGETTDLTFIDPNIMPDFTRTPPKQLNPFAGANFPSCVSYYQQRIVYGGPDAHPETLYFSQTAQFKNFDEAIPVKDDDAIEATMAALEINRVKFMVSMPGGLLVLTSGSTFQVNGGGPDAPITPASISAVPQTYNGCGDVSPLAIDFNVVYVQGQGSLIRSLTYNFYTGSYTPQDVSIFSQHLLRGFTIDDWCWAEEPDRIVWAKRSDGRLVSLTYLPDQKIIGMALHSTQGLIESVCSVQEGGENIVYLLVRRSINGVWKRFIERMMERRYKYGVEDAWNLDCAIERALGTPAATLTVEARTGTNILFTATNAFSSGDVGKIIRAGGGKATIISFSNVHNVRADITRDISDVIPETDTPLEFLEGEWSMASNLASVGGLWHLNNHEVSVIVDGVAQHNLTVTNGVVDFAGVGSKIVVGLPYTGWLKTLPIDSGQLPTIQGKRKSIHAVSARVIDTKGLEYGSREDSLVPFNLPSWDPNVAELMTLDQHIIMDPNWQEPGQFYVKQANPYPATVLGFIPELSVGDTGK